MGQLAISKVGSVLRRALSPLILRVARLLGIPTIHDRLDRIEASGVSHVQKLEALELHLERRISDLLMDLMQFQDRLSVAEKQTSDLRSLLDEAQKSVVATSIQHSEHLTGEVRNHLEKIIIRLTRDIDNLRRANTTSSGQELAGQLSVNSDNGVIDDALYISLEDHFRGSPEIILERQLEYVPYIAEVVSENAPLLDLGCGRGEWLQILKDRQIKAKGIDSNYSAVTECKEKGLDVESGNLIDILSSLPDASCGAITMFQVLEHLPFNLVVNTLREIRRVLIDGGVFIGEIPNSETLRVGASTFWIDPTHQRPLHPSLLTFIATTVGFNNVTGKYSTLLAPEPDTSEMPTKTARAIIDLHHAVNGPGDFALIATT